MAEVLLTVDLGFGDAGKGTVVDFLTRQHAAHTVVRYNGGAQAGHRVVVPGAPAREHVFAQFGSGTLAGADTHLSRFMLLEPLAMLEEERHLRQIGVPDAFRRTTIDARALVITPFQRAVNRLRELARGDARHGSCGMGVGETVADALAHGQRVLFAGDLARPAVLRAKLELLHAVNLAKARALLPHLPAGEATARELELLEAPAPGWLLDAYAEFSAQARVVPDEHLASLLRRGGTLVFEAAQGVLLDEWAGFHPHTTWSTTTLEHAERLLAEAGHTGPTTRVGITRAYTTRHGCGPLVSEDPALAAALPDACNGFGPWQQSFRVGWLDLVLLRYALELTGPLDYLAVTCLDRLDALPELKVCRAYAYDTFAVERIVRSPHPRDLAYQERLTECLARCRPLLERLPDRQALLDLLARELATPVGLVSEGPTAADKRLLYNRVQNG